MKTYNRLAIETMTVLGHFDYVLDGYAYGWAFSPNHMQERLKVEIICSGEVVSEGIANQPREDLLTAGVGDGKHAFKLLLSQDLFDGREHLLIARESITQTVLPGGPQTHGPTLIKTRTPQIRRADGIAELITSLKNNLVHEEYIVRFVQAYRLASLLQETGRLEEAYEAWKTILKALANHPLILCKLGEVLLLERRNEAALSVYLEAARKAPDMHWAYLGLSASYEELGQFDQAESSLKGAINLRPEDPYLNDRLLQLQTLSLEDQINILSKAGKQGIAVQRLKQILHDNPKNTHALELYGELLVHSPTLEYAHLDPLPIYELRKAKAILDSLLDDLDSDVSGL